MMPVRRTQSWLPSIFNDFFDNDWMVKANATAPAINVFETEKELLNYNNWGMDDVKDRGKKIIDFMVTSLLI